MPPRLRAALVGALGPSVALGTGEHTAFPAPEHLLALEPGLAGDVGLPGIKATRLRRLAERGASGDFDPDRLRAMSDEDARAWLERSPGIGPWASELVLIRGMGRSNLPRHEWRLLAAVQRYYNLPECPSFEDVEELGRRWGSFRSWAAFLLRVAVEIDARKPGACGAAGLSAEPQEHASPHMPGGRAPARTPGTWARCSPNGRA